MMRSKANALDQAIGFLSPSWQLSRMQRRAAIRIMAQHYDAGDLSRRTQEWKRPRGDANAASPVSLQRLRDAARQLVRNNGYAESAIGTIKDDVVGWGILPTAKNPAFNEWAGSTEIDADGRSDLGGLQEIVMRTVIESGECLIRRRRRRLSDQLTIPLQLEILEPDFIDSSKHGATKNGGKTVRGIEFDRLGRRVAYWLFKEHPGTSVSSGTSLSRLGSSVRVRASELLHVYKGGRPGQVRGVSWFASVLLRFNDFDEFADATLMKQKVAACLSVITSDVTGESTHLGAEDSNNTLFDRLEPGLIANAPPGHSIDVVNPPTVREYPDFVKTTLHEIASGLGVTPEDLTGDYSNMNFSSARMSRLRHWARVQGWRWRMMIPQFLTPLWGWAMEALELAGGETSENEDWTGAPLPMVEPDKEGLAITRNIRSGIMTPSEAIRERGYDPATFWDEYGEDFAELDRREIIVDSDARKMTQAGQAQFVTPTLGDPPEGPPEENGAGNGAGNGDAANFISVAEASRRFGITPQTIRNWIRKDAIPFKRIGPAGTIRLEANALKIKKGES